MGNLIFFFVVLYILFMIVFGKLNFVRIGWVNIVLKFWYFFCFLVKINKYVFWWFYVYFFLKIWGEYKWIIFSVVILFLLVLILNLLECLIGKVGEGGKGIGVFLSKL